LEERLHDFFTEARVILEDLRETLNFLMGLPQDDHRKPEALNNLFRQAHSLKGLSAIFNLEGVSGLSCGLEQVLGEVRLGRIPFSGEVRTLIGRGWRILDDMVRLVSEGKGDGLSEGPSLVRDLEDLRKEHRREVPADLSSMIDVPETVIRGLSEYEGFRFRENALKKIPLFLVTCCFPLETFDTELRRLGASIGEIGELLTTMPYTPEYEGACIGFSLYFASGEVEKRVRERLGEHGKGLGRIPFRKG
jgi:two-component system, chemotaxis family, sensor kinase CheA